MINHMSMVSLIEELIRLGVLQDPRLTRILSSIDRADFIPPLERGRAYLAGETISVGHGQTASSPLVVIQMIEWLAPDIGHQVLDIGCGLSWPTAILARLVAPKDEPVNQTGRVIGLEFMPELAKAGIVNLAKYGLLKNRTVEIHCLDGRKGFSPQAPYDRIISGVAATEIPPAWLDQLKIGGRIVAPAGREVWVIDKKTDQSLSKRKHRFTF
ncbi:MAG: protein-L-isoaspartate O-methyltransferase [Candidatus Paceibacterota bacterium]